jgi:AcrR family transcriptional regulator
VTSSETTAPPARLTKGAVVDRALQLADAVGLDALTIRKLATELGVTPMALYWHFRSKDELLAGLTERVWSEIDVAADPGADWLDRLRSLLESLLRVLRAHPAAPRLVMEHEKQNEAQLRATEVTLDILRGAGFTSELAAGIARNALWTGIMLVMSEPGAGFMAAEELAREQRRKRIEFATLPQEAYPNVIACAIPLTACDDPEAHYELGVSLFLAGVQALAARKDAGTSAVWPGRTRT